MGSVVRKVEAPRAKRLRDELEAQGFEFRQVPYTVFSATGPGVTVSYYTSGKLVVQGKGAEDFVAAFVEDPDEVFDDSRTAVCDRVTEPIIGTDESGKGDYFGPLVVAAFLIHRDDVPILKTLGVRDSKTVADGEALEIARQLWDAYPTRIHVIAPSVPRYNEMHREFGANLNNLLAWCHAKAVGQVLTKEKCARVISDKFGNERLIENELKKQGIEVQLEQRVRAESHPAVAAASILARARFLVELRNLGERVGYKLHKGAGYQVDAIARQIYREGGLEKLGEVAKLHFKTTEKAKRPQ